MPDPGNRRRRGAAVCAAPLYLRLRACGLGVWAEEDPEHPDGYVIRVRGLARLEPVEWERLRRRVREGKAELWQLLQGKPDRDARAVLEEGMSLPRSDGTGEGAV